MIKKNYQIKVYWVDGVFKRTISPSIIMNTIVFDSQINGWQWQLSLNLNVTIDNDWFEIGDLVKVYCYDDQHIDWRIVYFGSISRISRQFTKQGEYIQLICIWLFAFMSRIFYKDATDYVFNKTQDPWQTIIDMITYFKTIYPWIDFSTSEISLFWSNISLDFNYTKCNDVLKNIQAITSNFYFYIWSDLSVQYKDSSVNPTNHRLKIANQIDEIKIEENIEASTNSVFIEYWTTTEWPFEDSASKTKYWLIQKRASFPLVVDTAGATTAWNKYIVENKDEKKQITITINSKYDIESIKPWHTLTILNTDYTFDKLQVQKIKYTPDSIVVNVNRYETFAQSVLPDNI